eukprot:TRINITY_DN12671_c0_g1_i2.p1 TRINITY_DN12671_c0_g1~~TRINITY_DN12671_c0_g1_i2.p1  ORF type:complete len:644 (-),score=133.16 TRINITY_DN12671_c0_g1_i2:68-1999(-)
MANVYEDLNPMLQHGKKAFEHIMSKDLPAAAEAMDGQVTFVCDFVKEEMPLENKEGNAADVMVRQMIGDCCYSGVPEIKKEQEPAKEDILVFSDQAGLCQKILQKAPEGRVGTKKVVTKQPRLLTADDCDKYLSGKKYDLIIIAHPLDPPRSNTPNDIIQHQSHVDKFTFLLLQSILKYDGCCKKLCVLTHDIFSEEEDSNRDRGLSITSGGTMYGMVNTARQELEIPIALIDIEDVSSPEMVPFISSEIFRLQTFGANTVRLCWPYEVRQGIRLKRPIGRYVYRQFLSTAAEKAANKPFDIPSEGIIAISGGNGALGLVMADWILTRAKIQVEASGGKYVARFSIQLLSRSARISDSNTAWWDKVQSKAAELGVSVILGKMDMGSQAAVDKFVSEVSPNLVGFIHSAGVLQDAMLPNQTWEKFEAVYDSKHRAAIFLHDSLERFSNPNLKFLWVFSSTSAYGNMGQINYSASNTFLDALTRHRRALGKPCTAIHWGAWGEVGMAASMDDAMRKRVMMGPMPYFSVAQGLAGLEGGLRTGLPEFSVFIVNPPVMIGMNQGDGHPTLRYQRNFQSQWIPTPMPSGFTRDNTYDIYRMYRYIMAPFVPEDPNDGTLCSWNKYIKPVEAPEKDEEPEEQIIEADFL